MFKHSEFYTKVKEPYFTDRSIKSKVEKWIGWLMHIREEANFPITITDGVRYGNGSSQHFYNGEGAVDLRPSDMINRTQFNVLAELIANSGDIKRVCYYTKSKRFSYGGFHLDRKTSDHKFYINEGHAINWKRVSKEEFIEVVKSDI